MGENLERIGTLFVRRFKNSLGLILDCEMHRGA